jgi:hypothetical protein
MDRDDFIITVYCLVCEQYQGIRERYRLRRGGFAPALSDQEVITMEICGEYFKCATDQDIFDYFRAHYRTWFPNLTDRTLFVRQAANLLCERPPLFGRRPTKDHSRFTPWASVWYAGR